MAEGTPEQVAATAGGYTGGYLERLPLPRVRRTESA